MRPAVLPWASALLALVATVAIAVEETPVWLAVPAGLGAAVLAALAVRRTSERTEERFELLRALLRIVDDEVSEQEVVDRLLAVLVPDLADLCVIDLAHEGVPHPVGGRIAGPEVPGALDAFLRRRIPSAAGAAARRGEPQLLAPPPPDLLPGVAASPEDGAAMNALGLTSLVLLPLSVRGRVTGVLGLGTRAGRRPFRESDLPFLTVAAGRVAIAIDHAGLSRQVQTAQERLVTALGRLDEAVTITDRRGRIVYANDAALRILHVPSAEELLAASPGELMARFEITDEQGRPVPLEALPGSRALAGEDEPPPLLVRNVVRATGEERWLRNKVTALRGPDGHVEQVLNVIEDVTVLKRAERRQRLLADATEVLSSSLDLRTTLERTAAVTVPALTDWCALDLRGEHGEIEPVAIAHADPAMVELARELRERFPAHLDEDRELSRVIRTGEAILLPRVPDELLEQSARSPEHLRIMRELDLASVAVVPVPAADEVVGALTLVRSSERPPFTEDDVALARELARRAGTAVLNARLYEERAAIARELASGFLPPELPSMPGWATATLYRAAGIANEVGGDFYDVFESPSGWTLVVGDVAGQGARAASLTALARYTVRTAAQLTGDPVAAVEHLDRTLREREELSLVTVAVVCLDADEDGVAARVVCAGHPQPLLLRGGRSTEVGRTNCLAGAFADSTWEAETVRLEERDVLMLYTDGVTDTAGEDGRFGLERLMAALEGTPPDPEAAVDRVHAALRTFSAGVQRDDTAVLAAGLVDLAQASSNQMRVEPSMTPQRVATASTSRSPQPPSAPGSSRGRGTPPPSS